jgi:hypothetical protein
MEQNRESKNRPKHIWSTDFQQKCQGVSMGKESISNKLRQKNWVTIKKKKMSLDPYLTCIQRLT